MKRVLGGAMVAVVQLAVLTRAQGETVYAVTNYNWLQLEPNRVTATVTGNGFTNSTSASTSSYGPVSAFRWANFNMWIPTTNFTAGGASDYSATVMLDYSRNVKKVTVQVWADSSQGATISNFFVQGSTDGINYTTIGSVNYGSFVGGSTITNLTVTDGYYQYIRVRVPAGSYTSGTLRGGPGLLNIEPFGNGTFAPSTSNAFINWANKDVFGTVVTTSPNVPFVSTGLTFNGTAINNGLFDDANGGRVGHNANTWPTNAWAQIDLKAVRPLSQAVAVWDNIHVATSYGMQYSLDGTNFTPVTSGLSAPIVYGSQGALAYTFNAITAQYFRVVNVAGGSSGNTILDQFLLFGEQVPEPSSLLLALGGLMLVRRYLRFKPGS